MPVLANQRHEQFAQALSRGVSATRAYAQVYGESTGAPNSACRLMRNDEVCSRVKELKSAIAAGTVELEISRRDARINALQSRWDRLRAGFELILTERGKDMADVPGGGSGLLCRDFKGKDATQEVSKVDNGMVNLLEELRAHEKQAAEELGQWVERREDTGKQVIVVIPQAHPPTSARVIDVPPEEPPLQLPGVVIDLAPSR